MGMPSVSRPASAPAASGRGAPPKTSATRRLAAARLSRGAFDTTFGVLALVVALGIPLVAQGYVLVVLTLVLVYSVALLSLVVLTGYVGQISLCQASFMGLGAFLIAALMGHYHFSFWAAAPISIAVVALVGVAVGIPALRLRGLTLAIVTLSLALLADNFLFTDVSWLNNDGNFWEVTRPTIFGQTLAPTSPLLYWLVLFGTVLGILVVLRLRRGRTGKSWYALRDAEIAAATSGVPVVTMKLLGFAVAAALAALAGALYVLSVSTVNADRFSFVTSIQLLAIVVIAGIRSLPGAVLGAIFYIVFPQVLLSFPSLVPLTSLLLGLGLIVQVITAPQGLGGLLDQSEARFFRRLLRTEQPNTPTSGPTPGGVSGTKEDDHATL